jgi:hypothetical protein
LGNSIKTASKQVEQYTRWNCLSESRFSSDVACFPHLEQATGADSILIRASISICSIAFKAAAKT